MYYIYLLFYSEASYCMLYCNISFFFGKYCGT
uniref:Uncharacterized protein n=1 Tax=Anguilla anguilla TaxID=7936 RepID=A0A0E9UQG8_ANGAN